MRCCYNIPCWPSVGWHDLHFHDKIALKIKWNVFPSIKKVLTRKKKTIIRRKRSFSFASNNTSFPLHSIYKLKGQIAGNSRAMMTTLRFTLRPADFLNLMGSPDSRRQKPDCPTSRSPSSYPSPHKQDPFNHCPKFV